MEKKSNFVDLGFVKTCDELVIDCSSCSQYQAEIPRFKICKPARVCKACFDSLSAEKTQTTQKLSNSQQKLTNPTSQPPLLPTTATTASPKKS
jgi:hypothetical protein